MRGGSGAADAASGIDELELAVPPRPERVRTARVFVGAAARHFGIDDERVEDLKIAVSEAVTNAIVAQSRSCGTPAAACGCPSA